MITRRKFLGMLAALPAITALAGSGLRLPKREDIESDFDTANLKYETHERFVGGWTDPRGIFGNSLGVDSALSDKSLEDMLKHMREGIDKPPYYALQPTKIYVSPEHHRLAHDILNRRYGWLERLLLRLMPADVMN